MNFAVVRVTSRLVDQAAMVLFDASGTHFEVLSAFFMGGLFLITLRVFSKVCFLAFGRTSKIPL
jgi:hypothetical protein